MPCVVLNPPRAFLLISFQGVFVVFSQLSQPCFFVFFVFFTSIPQLPYIALSLLTKFQLQTLRCEDDALTLEFSPTCSHELSENTVRDHSPAQRRRREEKVYWGKKKKNHGTQRKKMAPTLELLIGTIDLL